MFAGCLLLLYGCSTVKGIQNRQLPSYTKGLTGLELMSEESFVVYPRCPFTVVSKLWIFDDSYFLK